MRLDKFLTECGIGTRSEVKKRIKDGQVTINGKPARRPEQKVEEHTDAVCVNSSPVTYEPFVYYLFHKPAGCVTAKTDRLHKTVMDYFPDEIRKKCSPVGRLDLDTEGLLLITNDGSLTHHLLSPAHQIKKTYFALLDSPVPADSIRQFETGIDIGDDKPTLPAELVLLESVDGQEGFPVELTISEGRFHQVKRMFAAVGCKVLYLKRLSMGNLTLEDLPSGEYRKLSPSMIQIPDNRQENI